MSPLGIIFLKHVVIIKTLYILHCLFWMILTHSCSIWNLDLSQTHCFSWGSFKWGYIPSHNPSYHWTQRGSRCFSCFLSDISKSFSFSAPYKYQIWISGHKILSPATFPHYINLLTPRSLSFLLSWFSVWPTGISSNSNLVLIFGDFTV